MSRLSSTTMNPIHPSLQLTDQAVLEQAQQRVSEMELLSEPNRTKWDQLTAIDILLQACVLRCSIEEVCNTLDLGVSSTTIRTYLNRELTDEKLGELERQANRALVKAIPRRLWKCKLQIAIDCHDEPFYGKDETLNQACCGGEAKDGTTHFLRIATAYVIFREMRVSVAFLFMRPTDTLAEIVASLMRRLNILACSLKCLYCDRGFCSIPVLKVLDALKIPALLACPIRGKSAGTRKLCLGERSYTASHTFKSQPYGQFTANIAVTFIHTARKRKSQKKPHSRYLLFVVLHQNLDPASALRRYKNRFGIESSYRSLRRVKAKTSSLNLTLRYFFFAIALLLVNLWLYLRFFFIQSQSSYRFLPLQPNVFPFYRLIHFISQSIIRFYGTISSIANRDIPITG